jgi:hypothetical protein
MGGAHTVVVPTTAQYYEGVAMTAAEAVLAGRPVVLSSVVPAREVPGDAAIVAETGNADSFVEPFRKLALDAEYYERCRWATACAQAQFYTHSKGLGAVPAAQFQMSPGNAVRFVNTTATACSLIQARIIAAQSFASPGATNLKHLTL